MSLLNTLILHRNARSCHERGVCQRTEPHCHHACHFMPSTRGEQPMGYETAPASNVHQLHRGVAPGAMHVTDPDEVQDRPADPWVTMANILSRAVVVVALLALIVLIGHSLRTHDSWLHRLGEAAMHVSS